MYTTFMTREEICGALEAENVVLGIELGSTRIKAIALAAMGFPVSVLETAGEGAERISLVAATTVGFWLAPQSRHFGSSSLLGLL